MNKNINTVVELTEKELECVTGGMRGKGRVENEFLKIAYRPHPVIII